MQRYRECMKQIKIDELPEVGVSHNARIRKKVLLENEEIPRVTHYSRAVFPAGERAESHSHADLVEVFTVESGCGEICINETPYVFSAGTTMVVETGEMHEIVNTGSTELVVSYFGVRVD